MTVVHSFDKIITKETIGVDYKNSARFISEKAFEGCKVDFNILTVVNKETASKIDRIYENYKKRKLVNINK